MIDGWVPADEKWKELLNEEFGKENFNSAKVALSEKSWKVSGSGNGKVTEKLLVNDEEHNGTEDGKVV
ncbi:hypothetical protein TNIN_386321 [Trichonephila inaurata madagascariensis]|uniref:Uncharacterized protein n=1 Tax=Trichonephila inaurata madagascariensis TaxID=2747483 RepID=A0A8X6XAH0_9ARAC|nr:hypothetical protein TNIN_386321 [Trichonephila inaurata madagascariensis]